MTAPLVSTIIMTRRPAFVAGAIAMMRAQTYPNVEVVLGLHGLRAAELPAEGREALASADRVLELPGSQPLGTCMNMATAASQGDVIAKIDDDDLYGPCYLAEAAAALAAGEGDVVGKMETYVFLSDERQLLLWRPGASLQRQSGLAGPTLFFPRRLGEAPGFRPLPSAIDRGFLTDCKAQGCHFYSTSRRHYVLRRMPAANHHTWQTANDYFREDAVVLRRNLTDDSPEALIRIVGDA
jgi:glycosyltransferase involved in cell wall biosynthesis